MKIELSVQQIQNLKQLLQRVDIKGAEVPVYIDILNAINKPEKEEPNGGSNKTV